MRVIVKNLIYCLDLMGHVLEPISTESSLVYEKVCNLLGVQNSLPGVIDLVDVTLFHAELYPVDSISYAEPGINHSFNHCNNLLIRVFSALVMESAHWNEQLAQVVLFEDEIGHGYA